MILRWALLVIAFLVPPLALAALQVGPALSLTLSRLAIVLGVAGAAVWLAGVRNTPALPNDEMAHHVKNHIASGIVVLQNAALVAILVTKSLTGLAEADVLKMIYAIVLLGVWAYAVAVAFSWRTLGR